MSTQQHPLLPLVVPHDQSAAANDWWERVRDLAEDDVFSLMACATAHRRFSRNRFDDPLARQIVSSLGIDVSATIFSDEDEVRMLESNRNAILIDELAREFFGRHAEGMAVSLFGGLCTRFSRIDNGTLKYIELDDRETTSLKLDLIRSSFGAFQSWIGIGRHIHATCCSIRCLRWMHQLHSADDVPTVIIAPSLHRADTETRDSFFTHASLHLATDTEIIVTHDLRAAPPLQHHLGSFATFDENASTWIRYPRLRFINHHTNVAHLRVT
jgi:O-methyltransferase involved in polyketide biosynthesis